MAPSVYSDCGRLFYFNKGRCSWKKVRRWNN